MDDEGEGACVGRGNAVEYQDCGDGKVPRSGTVGGRDDDGNGSYAKGNKGNCRTEPCRKIEAEKGDGVVEKVAKPSGNGVGEVDGEIDFAER